MGDLGLILVTTLTGMIKVNEAAADRSFLALFEVLVLSHSQGFGGLISKTDLRESES